MSTISLLGCKISVHLTLGLWSLAGIYLIIYNLYVLAAVIMMAGFRGELNSKGVG
jgi:hypothetical protein